MNSASILWWTPPPYYDEYRLYLLMNTASIFWWIPPPVSEEYCLQRLKGGRGWRGLFCSLIFCSQKLCTVFAGTSQFSKFRSLVDKILFQHLSLYQEGPLRYPLIDLPTITPHTMHYCPGVISAPSWAGVCVHSWGEIYEPFMGLKSQVELTPPRPGQLGR